MRPARTLLALLLLVLPAALAGATPKPAAWGPYAPGPQITDVAVADDALVAAVANAAPPPPSPGGTTPGVPSGAPQTARFDATALNLSSGPMWTNSVSSQFRVGKDHAAISRDGRAMATASEQGNPPATSGQPSQSIDNVVYYDVGASLTQPQQPATPFMAPRWAKRLVDGVRDVVVSADGSVVAAAEQRSGRATVHAWNARGDELINYPIDGNASSLALTADGTILAIGGDEIGAGGILVLLNTRGSGAGKFAVDSARVTAVALSRTGQQLLAGTSEGKLVVFRPTATDLGVPERTFAPAIGAVREIVFSHSTTAAVAGGEQGYAVVDLRGGDARVANEGATTAPVTRVDVSGDGAYFLVVARDALGFSLGRNEPVWNLTGPFTGGGIDDDARVLVLSTATSVRAYSFARGLAFLHRTPAGTTGTLADPPLPAEDGSFRYPVTVVSNGSAFDRVAIDLPEAPGITFSVDSERVDLAPGTSRDVEIVARPGSLMPGEYTFTAVARSVLDGSVANLTLPVRILQSASAALSLQGNPDRVLQRGETDEAVFVFANTGNVRANATFEARQQTSAGTPWSVVVTPSATAVPGGGTTTFVVRVVPPSGIANGTSNRILVTARSDIGTSAQATLSYVFSPNLGVRLDTASRVKFVGPAQSTWFNLTVTNTGSVRTLYEIFYDVSEDKGGWNVDVDISRFEVAAGATVEKPMRVYAPAVPVTIPDDQARQYRISLFVEARTVDMVGRKPIAAENLTLIANLNPDLRQKPPDYVPPDGVLQLPDASLALAFAALGAAAFTCRRRERR